MAWCIVSTLPTLHYLYMYIFLQHLTGTAIVAFQQLAPLFDMRDVLDSNSGQQTGYSE
jgi:hypothetical protein